jgi:hypothetical protein
MLSGECFEGFLEESVLGFLGYRALGTGWNPMRGFRLGFGRLCGVHWGVGDFWINFYDLFVICTNLV